MIGSFIFESTATTGTGTITLGGALNGYIAVGDHFDDNATVRYIIRDGDDFQVVQGVYDSSGDTLTRDVIFSTLDGGTYTKSGASAISLSGNAKIICDWTHADFNKTLPGVESSFNKLISNHIAQVISQRTVVQNREYYMPYLWKGGEVGSLTITVQTGVASTNARLAIYTCDGDGKPGELIQDAGAVSTASTGDVTATFTSLWLNSGWYYTFLISNDSSATMAVKSAGISQCGQNPLGCFQQINASHAYASGTYGAAPSSASTSLTSDITDHISMMWGP